MEAQKRSEIEWESRHAEIEKVCKGLQEQLTSVTTERDSLLKAKGALEAQLGDGKSSVAQVQQQLEQTRIELTATTQTLQQAQAELKSASRRAEEAERNQTDLRSEGSQLIRNLEEVRSKVVELTDAKLDLQEKVEGLGKVVKERDETIAQLEGTLDELREQQSSADRKHQDLSGTLEKERSSAEKGTAELQQAYAELQKELEDARADAHHLESERSEYQLVARKQTEEVDRLSSSVQSYAGQISSIRAELDERKRAQDEAREFLDRARGELEVSRRELAAKEEEVERLREATATSPTSPNGPHSLNAEMVSALEQQHQLQLSAAQSQIRALETAQFEAEAHAHALQKQLAALEDQMSALRAGATSRNSQRPPISTRGSSGAPVRHVETSDELRRASFQSTRSGTLVRPMSPPSSFEGLSADTRHKRRVSLGMLKARIDSEAASTKSHPSSRNMSPAQRVSILPTVPEPSSRPDTPPAAQGVHRMSQFLDESHIFWCSSCKGDLVIL